MNNSAIRVQQVNEMQGVAAPVVISYSASANEAGDGSSSREVVPSEITQATQATLTISTDGHGSIITPGTGSFIKNLHSIISLSTTPNSNYVFSNWTTTGSIVVTNSTSASTTATINGTGTITANFAALYNNYWGTGADGSAVLLTNTSYTSTQDSDVVVKHYTSLTINSGVTVTTSTRCKGLVIYVKGNCTINGTLTMTARGAFVNPTTAGVSANGIQFLRRKTGSSGSYAASVVSGCGTALIAAEANQSGTTGTSDGVMLTIPISGAAYAPQTPGNNRNTTGYAMYNNGTGGQTGSGGGTVGMNSSGGAVSQGYGAAGTCFSGGAGAGGLNNLASPKYQYYAPYTLSIDGGQYGGAGGTPGSVANAGSGGAGNPGGAAVGSGYSAGSSGTGGFLALFVSGTLTIGSTGIISSNGSAGGASTVSGEADTGGGSGGGTILIAYAGSYVNSGTVQAAGGAGGTDAASFRLGSRGGAGSVQVFQIKA